MIYPVLPNRFIDPWNILDPREAWFTVILIASIGFLNYVLLRLYSARGLFYAAVLGGLVNDGRAGSAGLSEQRDRMRGACPSSSIC